MDLLKRKAKEIKSDKRRFKKYVPKTDDSIMKGRHVGPAHISEEDYGTYLNGMFPLTNRYVKKVKEGLKAEYRAAKRGEKQQIKKSIEEELLEEF